MIEEALDSSNKFFDLPIQDKNVFSSEEVSKPVRFVTTGTNDDVNANDLKREFIKIYAHPIEHWIEFWPPKPEDYRYVFYN